MTREEAIKVLKGQKYPFPEHPKDVELNTAIDMAVSALSENKREWIPVSERVPEDDQSVLVWCPERKNIYCAYREENQWWIFGAYFEKLWLDVVAWMSLPEPYKAESEVKPNEQCRYSN